MQLESRRSDKTRRMRVSEDKGEKKVRCVCCSVSSVYSCASCEYLKGMHFRGRDFSGDALVRRLVMQLLRNM